jgi:hypothetical protein
MANIVLSYSEIKFWIRSMLPILFTFQNWEIILPDPKNVNKLIINYEHKL